MTINGLITCGRKKEEEKPQNTYKNSSKDGMRVHFLKIAPKKAVKERRNVMNTSSLSSSKYPP